MNEENGLPSGWVWTRVGEIYNIVGGGTPSTDIEEYWNGDIAWITSADIYSLKDIRPRKRITKTAIENSATNLVPEDSLIVVTRVGLGKVALTKKPLCFSQDSQALIGDRCSIYPDYSLYYLAQAVQVFKYQNRGTTIAGVTKKQLSELPFALPPLPEQQRIVAAIEQQFSRLDAGIAALRRAQAKLKRYRAAILKAAVEGKLTEAWRAEHPATEPASKLLERILAERRTKCEADLRAKGKDPAKVRYVEPAKPDVEGLPELPEGWWWATLDEVGRWNGGGTPSKARERYWVGGNIPWVSPKDMKTLRIIDTEDHLSATALEETTLKLCPARTVLIVVRSGILVRTLPVAVSQVPVTMNQDMKGINPEDGIQPMYIAYSLISSERDILSRCAKDGTTVASIESESLKTYPIPLPPSTEQEQIVAEVERRLSVLSQLEATVEASLKRAERLRQSILKEAFAGRLVPQDASDESASVLLERIRKEREGRKQGAVNKGRGVIGAVGEPVKIDVREVKEVGLWERVFDRLP